VNIFDIEVFNDAHVEDAGGALVCMTANLAIGCCRRSDGGNVGEWYFPNGTIVPRHSSFKGKSFTRSGFTQQVRLNRINTTSPVGEFVCRVPDGIKEHTASIIIGEWNNRPAYVFVHTITNACPLHVAFLHRYCSTKTVLSSLCKYTGAYCVYWNNIHNVMHMDGASTSFQSTPRTPVYNKLVCTQKQPPYTSIAYIY